MPCRHKRYLVLSAVVAITSQAAVVAAPRVTAPSGCVISPFDPGLLLLLAFIGATVASVVLSALGALLWLRGGLRRAWDVDLAVASALNALPLVYVALGRLGVS